VKNNYKKKAWPMPHPGPMIGAAFSLLGSFHLLLLFKDLLYFLSPAKNTV
jgi:hypothetical protein